MRDRLIIASILGGFWAMHPHVMDNMRAVLMRHAQGIKVEQAEIDRIVASRGSSPYHPTTGNDPYALEGSVAVIGIGGVIAPYSNQVNGSSQPRGTSAEAAKEAVVIARSDKRVKSIVLLIDSPGGSVAGVEDLAAEVFATRKVKPIYAVTSGMCCSAAYWIACQANKMYAQTPTDVFGSIGVYTVLEDWSKAFAKEGITVDKVATHDHKGIGVMGTEITADQRAVIQKQVHDFGDQFRAAVKRGRGASDETVKGWATGETWLSNEATSMGLIDGVKTVEALVSDLNATNQTGGSRFAHASSGAASGHDAQEFDMRFAQILRDPVAGGGGGGTQAASNPSAPAPTNTGTQPSAGGGAAPAAPATPATPATPAASNGGQSAPAAPSGQTPDPAAAAWEANQRVRLELAALRTSYGHVPGVKDILMAASNSPTIPNMGAVRDQVLTKAAEQLKPIGSSVVVGADGRDRKRDALTLALLVKHRPQIRTILDEGGPRAKQTARALGYADPAAASKAIDDVVGQGFHHMRMHDILVDRMNASGFDFRGEGVNPHDIDGVFKAFNGSAGMGSSDFPKLLSNLQNKNLEIPFDEEPKTWPEFCRVVTLTDYKARNVLRLSEAPNLDPIAEGKLPEYGSFNERGEAYVPTVYGKKFGWTMQMQRNDDMGAFLAITDLIRLAVARLPEAVVWSMLLQNLGNAGGVGPIMAADGKRLFSAEHKNLGGAADLGYDAVVTGRKTIREQTGFGPDKANISVEAKFVACGASNEETALQLWGAQYKPATGLEQNNQMNTLKSKFRPLITNRIKKTAWLLLPAPSTYPVIELGFIDGQQNATVEMCPRDSITRQDFEVILPGMGGAAVNYEGAYCNPGTDPV